MAAKESQWFGSYGRLFQAGLFIACLLWVGLAVALTSSLLFDAFRGATVAESKDLIGPMVTGTGVLIAVLAFLRDRHKIANDRRETRSKILYEQAKAGLESAFELLADKNNDRVTWIRAARVLESSRHLGGLVESEEYREAYRLAEDAVRSRLYDALTIRGEGGQRNALPAAFFFGDSDWRACELSIDEVAKRNGPHTRVFSISPDTVVPDQVLKNLAERSVISIMGFLEFPEDYADPLSGVDRDAFKGWREAYGPTQGARQFLQHLQKYAVINGTLISIGSTRGTGEKEENALEK